MQTFTSSEEVLAYLQQRFGSANFKSWQTIRKTFYSFQQFPAAGVTILNFFGTPIGQLGRQFTNIPKANTVGQNHFLVKAIKTAWSIPDTLLGSYAQTDATTLYSDLVNGPFQAGVLEFNINARTFAQIPKPFLKAPPGQGGSDLYTACIGQLALVEGTPNVLSTASCNLPYATQLDRHEESYLLDPNILIEAEQNFEVNISWPSGAIGLIATTINNDVTNPLRLGVLLDGILFRPVQ